MKVLVTGVKGQLGYDVMRHLAARGIPAVGVDIDDFDLTDRAATEEAILRAKPDAVIHCAAYTAVDRAEDDEALCRRVNVDGTENVAAACARLGAKMMYISTDYVFPGTGETPYEPGDPKGPRSVYGRTKLEGEEAMLRLVPEKHFIVRISWVFGVNGKNFIRTMLRLGAERERLTVVADQIGSPTYTDDLARLLCDMIVTEKYGVYHATNEGPFVSWADFAAAIMREAGLGAEIVPIPTSEYPARAERPLNSRMSKKCLDEAGFMRLPTWEDALRRYVAILKAQ